MGKGVITKRGIKPKAAAAYRLRRRLFIEAYLSNGFNGTQAAIAAGFSRKTAGAAGGRLLRELRVSGELAARAAEAAERAELTAERTLREIARTAYADPEAAVTWGDKLNALDKAARIQGLYAKDNEQRPAAAPVQVQVVLVGPQ